MIDSPVYLANDFDNELGMTIRTRGRLDLAAGNLDAQLIRVTDNGRLRAALGDFTIDPGDRDPKRKDFPI